MKVTLQLPVTLSDKEVTSILNDLNKLGVPHHLSVSAWYNRELILDVDHNFVQLLAGIKLGRVLTPKRK